MSKYKKECIKDSKFSEAKEARQKITNLWLTEENRIAGTMRIAHENEA